MKLYIQKNGQTVGPLTEEEVLSGLEDGRFAESDLATAEGHSEWWPLSSLIVREPASGAAESPSGVPNVGPTTATTPAQPSPSLPSPASAFNLPNSTVNPAAQSASGPTNQVSSPHYPHLKQGGAIGGWLCFALGSALMYWSLWAFYLYIPLLLVALILSVVALAQRRIVLGMLLLLTTLLMPPLEWFLLFGNRVFPRHVTEAKTSKTDTLPEETAAPATPSEGSGNRGSNTTSFLHQHWTSPPSRPASSTPAPSPPTIASNDEQHADADRPQSKPNGPTPPKPVPLSTAREIAAAEREEAVSEEAATIQVLDLRIKSTFRGREVVLKCKNSGSKPVKAFKGKWVVFDDFNDVSQSDAILFTSITRVLAADYGHAPGSNTMGSGYLIQPDAIVYLDATGDQRGAMVGSAAYLDDIFPTSKKRFKAVITKVVFAEGEDIDKSHEQEEAARKQEEATREQERLRQQQMARQAEEAARQTEQMQRFRQISAQSRIPTRELARIPMEDRRENFIITDVSVERQGVRIDFGRVEMGAGGSRAIIDDGIYHYFANQADRDKALRILKEAIKAWKEKFPEVAALGYNTQIDLLVQWENAAKQPSTRSFTADSAAEFVKNWLQADDAATPDSPREGYTDPVNYYGKDLTMKEFDAENRSYRTKWPNRQKRLVGPITVSESSPGKEWRFTFTLAFSVSNGTDTVDGEQATTLGLRMDDGMKIFLEDGKITRREKHAVDIASSASNSPGANAITADQISSWNLTRIQNAINDIYAKYGTEFPNRYTQERANKLPWYHRVPGRTPEIAEKMLSDSDKTNIETLAARRDALRADR